MIDVQSSLIGIISMALVVVVGAIIGVLYSRTSVQVRAVIISFVALGLVVIGFCIGAIGFSLWWSSWMFAVAAIAVPFISYVAAVLLLGSSKRLEAERPRKTVSQPKPTESKVATAASVPPQPGKGKPAVTTVVPAKDKPTASKPVTVKAPTIEVPAIAEKPEPVAAIAEKPKKEEPTAAPTPKPALKPIPTIEAAPELEVAPKAEPTSAPKPIAKPKVEAKPKPLPQPTPKPAKPVIKPVPATEKPVPTVFNADEYFERASVLRDKGLYLVAARLYAECVEHAQDMATIRKAQLEQLTCYVQANMVDQARELAEQLHKIKDLKPLEKLKAETVLRKL